MRPGWLERFMNFMGLADPEDEVEEEEVIPRSVDGRGRNKAAVLSLHTAPDVKIVVVSPVSFDEAEKLAGHLKSRKPVIVNFEQTPKEIAQRIIDFLSGAVLALNGSTRKVTVQTFLFVPSNVSILADELASSLRERLFFKLDQGGAGDRYQEQG